MARNEHKKVLQQLSETYQNVIKEARSDAALWRDQLEKEGPGLDFPKQKVKGQLNRSDGDDGERGAPLWPPTDPEKIAQLKRAADRVRGRSRPEDEEGVIDVFSHLAKYVAELAEDIIIDNPDEQVAPEAAFEMAVDMIEADLKSIEYEDVKDELDSFYKTNPELTRGEKVGGFEGPIISQLDVEAAARERLRQKYGEDNEEEALPSENFDQSYAIFINGDSIPGYLDFIQQKGWKGVGVMKAAFDHKLGVIVIPPELDYDAIEGELFKIQSEKEYGQFWGQRGIGYKGKKWIPVGGATEDNEEPRRGISGYEHKPDAFVSARQAGAKHKPYVSSFVSDGGKIFGVMGSDGKIVHKTRDKQKAYQWLKDNYDNI